MDTPELARLLNVLGLKTWRRDMLPATITDEVLVHWDRLGWIEIKLWNDRWDWRWYAQTTTSGPLSVVLNNPDRQGERSPSFRRSIAGEKAILDYAPKQPTSPASERKPNRKRKGEIAPWETAAATLHVQHRDWTDKQIAEHPTVNVHPAQLTRSDFYQNAKDQTEKTTVIPPGHHNSKTGDHEAYTEPLPARGRGRHPHHEDDNE